jgi:hypothetical protein
MHLCMYRSLPGHLHRALSTESFEADLSRHVAVGGGREGRGLSDSANKVN